MELVENRLVQQRVLTAISLTPRILYPLGDEGSTFLIATRVAGLPTYILNLPKSTE